MLVLIVIIIVIAYYTYVSVPTGNNEALTTVAAARANKKAIVVTDGKVVMDEKLKLDHTLIAQAVLTIERQRVPGEYSIDSLTDAIPYRLVFALNDGVHIDKYVTMVTPVYDPIAGEWTVTRADYTAPVLVSRARIGALSPPTMEDLRASAAKTLDVAGVDVIDFVAIDVAAGVFRYEITVRAGGVVRECTYSASWNDSTRMWTYSIVSCDTVKSGEIAESSVASAVVGAVKDAAAAVASYVGGGAAAQCPLPRAPEADASGSVTMAMRHGQLHITHNTI